MPTRSRRTPASRPASARAATSARLRAAVVPAALGSMLVAGLAACGEQDAEPTSAAETTTETTTGPTSPASAQTPSPDAGGTTGPSAPSSPAGTESDRSKATLARLLEPEMLGGMNEQWLWRTRSTGNDDPENLATCHRFSLGAIGAEEVGFRSFDSPSGEDATAAEAVARFPDLETARRAYAVLRSWHASCQSRLDSGGAGRDAYDVGPLEPVAAAGPRATWYLLTGPGDGPDTSTFEAVGYALRDNHVAAVVIRSVGQDYNYEPGEEPVPVSLRAAARLLG